MGEKTLTKKFYEFVENNNLKSFREMDNRHYYLPYKSESKNIRIFLFANIFEESRIVKIGFKARLREDKNDIENIRIILLDLNSKLTMGSLSLEKDSNIIEFSIDYTVEDDENVDIDRYNRIILYNINMYYDLYEKNLIERENSMNE